MQNDQTRPFFLILAVITVFLSPSQTAYAQINPSPVDIKGVKLGMTLDEATVILEDQAYEIMPLPKRYFYRDMQLGDEKQRVEFGHAVRTLMAKKKDGNDVIHLSTVGSPERNNIVVVARALKYPEIGSRPIWAKVTEQISQKYGKPHEKKYSTTGSDARKPYLLYEWNSKGKERSGAGAKRLLNGVASLGDKPVRTQSECFLPEKAIAPNFGKNLSFDTSKDLEKDYNPVYLPYFSYVDNYIVHGQGSSYAKGPRAIRGATKLRGARKDVLASSLCRTFFLIRGNIHPSTNETTHLMFMMMDHKAVISEIKYLDKWHDEKIRELEAESLKKIKTIQDQAPDIDL